jgi:arylsulfatase A-like enzyme
MYGGFERIASERTLVSEALPDHVCGGFHSNLYLSAEFGYDRGFETLFDSKSDPSTVARVKQFVKDRLDEDGWLYGVLAGAVDTAERQAGVNVGSAYVRADELTDRALEWVRTHADADRPRFLWVHYMDVHHPYVPPAEYQRHFRDDPVSERRAVQLRRKFVENQSLPEDERETVLDLYDAEIRFTDAELERLLDGVREAWGTDPVVLFTSDHGEAFGEHGRYSHPPTFHDEVLHVPLVLDVGDGAGAAHDDLVGLLDVAPTLVDYGGADQPENFHGHSLRRLVEDDGWPRERVVGDWADDGVRTYAVRTHEWKYVRRKGDLSLDDAAEELYDLAADPGEHENVVDGRPEQRDRFREVVDDHEDAVASTRTDLAEVEMDAEVKSRLRDLGYRE